MPSSYIYNTLEAFFPFFKYNIHSILNERMFHPKRTDISLQTNGRSVTYKILSTQNCFTQTGLYADLTHVDGKSIDCQRIRRTRFSKFSRETRALFLTLAR